MHDSVSSRDMTNGSHAAVSPATSSDTIRSVSPHGQRFAEVIDFIDDHLSESLSVDQLAHVAHCSPYHFHRQFSAYFSMSLYRYIQVRRLQVAAQHLINEPTRTVMDIALAADFGSAEAFSRAFKRHFGQSPTVFRQVPDWSRQQWERLSFTRIRNTIMQDQITVRIVQFPALSLMTLSHRGSPLSLSTSIAEFTRWRQAHGLSPATHRTFNLMYNDPQDIPPDAYRCDLGVSVPDDFVDTAVDSPMQPAHIPAGRCAQVRHIGHDEGLRDLVSYLYTAWLPESGETVREFPLFVERVAFPPAVPEAESIVDIYLPIH